MSDHENKSRSGASASRRHRHRGDRSLWRCRQGWAAGLSAARTSESTAHARQGLNAVRGLAGCTIRAVRIGFRSVEAPTIRHSLRDARRRREEERSMSMRATLRIVGGLTLVALATSAVAAQAATSQARSTRTSAAASTARPAHATAATPRLVAPSLHPATAARLTPAEAETLRAALTKDRNE